MNDLERAIAIRIAEHGPIGFDEFVDHALYAPDLGFYTRPGSTGGAGGAGRRRDFLTSPEVGPLFGAVLARALDSWWIELGRPDSYVVVEAGAGPGTLARTLLAARPACLHALRLVLVEKGTAQWPGHPEGVETRTDLPALGELGNGPVVVLANELLDNLPFGLVELVQPNLDREPGPGPGPRTEPRAVSRDADTNGHDGATTAAPTWCEVHVDTAPGGEAMVDPDPDPDPGGSGRRAKGAEGDAGRTISGSSSRVATPRFVERFIRLDAARQGWCWGRAGRSAPVGTRLPVQADSAAWLADALDLAGNGGRVVALDYASITGEMARRPWTEWVRTYRNHARGGLPLSDPGGQDITCEVAVDQLATVARPDFDRAQAEFLRAHGIDDLVADGRRRWADEGIAGGLDVIAARSRVHEADALTDPDGLGAFRVLEWTL